MSHPESLNNDSYINSDNKDFFSEVEKFSVNTKNQTESNLPPQSVPELPLSKLFDEMNRQEETDYSYINSDNKDFFSEVEKFSVNTKNQTESNLPPQSVPELPLSKLFDEMNRQSELKESLKLKDPIIIGLKGILASNQSNEDRIMKRTPINRMDRKTLKIIHKVNISAQALLDKKLDDLK